MSELSQRNFDLFCRINFLFAFRRQNIFISIHLFSPFLNDYSKYLKCINANKEERRGVNLRHSDDKGTKYVLLIYTRTTV